MISHIVELSVSGAKAEQFYDFMINPDSRRYREWWAEEHLEFRIVKRGSKEYLGDEVYYDEYLGGKRRLAFFAVVTAAIRPNKIIWQMKKAGTRLPAYLDLELHDSPEGIQIRHELRIGYPGIGRIFDPFIRIYFNKSFRAALEEHCRIEWLKLAEYLNKE
jgi:hypothetical protein